MGNPQLQPVKLVYVKDDCLPEGRWLIPVSLDFSKNVFEANAGATRISQYILSSTSIQGTINTSPIKGILVEYFIAAAQAGSILRILINETGQEFYVGAQQDYSATENVVAVAMIPVYCPKNCTISVQEIQPVVVAANTDWCKIQLVNFEVEPFASSMGADTMIPFGGLLTAAN